MTDVLYRATGLPVFQNHMYRTREDALAAPRGDVELVQDAVTGLVHNRAFRPELLVYGPDYQNEQAVSGAFRAHLDDVSAIVGRHLRGRSILEVGCGKGYFLERLASAGFSVRGVDPAYEGDSSDIVKARFTADLGLRADGIVLRHVLEHIQAPHAFLAGIRDANGGRGTVYIEVPCLDWICTNRAWFDVFYEHVNYFRLQDFTSLFGTVHEAGRIFGGQYLYVVADLATLRTPRFDPGENFAFPTDFLATVAHHAALFPRQGDAPGAIVWGGASKGLIYSLFVERAGGKIDRVVDINPAKQGRYLGATGLRVDAPDEALRAAPPGTAIVVMNANYLPEIRQATHNRFRYLTVNHEDV